MTGPRDDESTRSRTVTRVLAVCAALVAASAVLSLSTPAADADPVATTALVLRVVDGDTVDIVDDTGVASACGCWGSTHRKQETRLQRPLLGLEATEFARSTLVGQRVAHTRPHALRDRPLRSHLGLPRSQRRLGLFGRGRSRRRRPTRTSTVAAPPLATML